MMKEDSKLYTDSKN